MKFKKTASALMASLVLAGAVSLPALAAEGDGPAVIAPAPAEETYGYQLEVNGAQADKNVPILVPLRTVAEALNFTVAWNGDGTVSIDSGSMHTLITIGRDSYQAVTSLEGAVGATGPLSLGAAPVVVGGATYVPLELFDILLGNGAVTLEDGRITVDTGAGSVSVQIPSPWVELDTMEQAAEKAGFGLTLPAEAEKYAERVYQVMSAENGAMLEVLCRSGDDRLIIRKAPGTGDISGEYTPYGQETAADVGGVAVTLRGDGGLYRLAVWSEGDYAYSLSSTAGFSQERWQEMISCILEQNA